MMIFDKEIVFFRKIITVFCLFYLTIIQAQDISVNVDSLYYKANNLYKNKEYNKAFSIVNKALNIAPEYIDIRVLRIRISQQLQDLNSSKKDLLKLLSLDKSEDYKRFVFNQLNKIETTKRLTDFINEVDVFYKNNSDFDLFVAESYFRFKDIRSTRNVMYKISKRLLNDKQKYRYRLLLKKINKNQIGVYYDITTFKKEYSTQKTWHTTQLEYMNFIGMHSVGVRVTHSKRFIDDAFLYELESYPVFNQKTYGFVNVSGSSKSDFFQNLGIKSSIYYTVLKWLEVEAGFRYLSYNTDDFTSYVIGVTSYQNKFYLNARVFIGPKIGDDFIQNYQANIRYYYKSAEDYLFLRVGTGISPDESSRFTQVIPNPDLNSYYINLGATKSVGHNYNVSVRLGYLTEELSNNRVGNQLQANIGLKYRF
ncbi:YaiO family outer membrane beta-barrel protein [Tenacibaculum pacificus]|uniref:YaiO family outer membrane beta-barrel protein n=1 Tax=Tenacibaculum pacificus TaxID=3018314 RepID=UPI0022F38F21|nr:YaiO family outer membrane beta-barrel protein [Tenacibaculum pacificus]WBX73163.1 YaiO family outer membrane beta-barrel protein [Tenacibaculum pacificus]